MESNIDTKKATSIAIDNQKKVKQKWNLKRTWPLHVFMMPAVILALVFNYAPLPGIAMAFMDFKPYLGFTESTWVGLEQFKRMIEFEDARQVIWNTLVISSLKIFFNLVIPIIFALLLNEIRKMAFKRTIQTFVYLPHFLSWVILGGILLDMLSVDGGIINNMLGAIFGMEPIFFLGEGDWFRFTVILSDVWKDFGFGAVIFLAALSGINPDLYEAATIDGANRFQQVLHITLPSLIPITVVVATLALGNTLNAGFDQIFNLYNPLVYEKGDIIDTYVYRMGLLGGQFSFATAVGLFKSVIGFVLIVTGYRLAYKYANYRIF
ncbi:ABC transporter permease subunit [Lederbergia lenta]|uniref:Polysaccharide ABC transporter permease n=1 Tax=Lederbergia lenta TaxID=1467 RepID=A0A2X4WJI0_LEDLE|nr:ABC transporter permease subunit [Lederbergia lenta]MCM3112176.1 ABC transporter permease subunit [Lederbergia lenta]MEC2323343.1 ABC transporter permease subunit [Lederbergia lenta]SQI63251.1 polysaccharide ABC transporter permease [Lederbergia lenta]